MKVVSAYPASNGAELTSLYSCIFVMKMKH